jgi:serine/threonine protein kinase
VDASRHGGLKREVTIARLLRESLGERNDFVHVLEWNFNARPYFLESEYAGPNLLQWATAQGGLAAIPMDFRLKLLADIAGAVAAAHSVGVLHKDLKPANVLIASSEDGGWQVKLADFGSGSMLDPSRLTALGITSAGFTQTAQAGEGGVTGTYMYLAPELLAGHSPSPASDVYALGLLLYQMVVGDFRRLLSPGWEADVVDPVLRDDIASAACGDPARRLASGAEFAGRLRTLNQRRAQFSSAELRNSDLTAAAQKPKRSHLSLMWMGAAGIFALVVLSIAFLTWGRQRPTAAAAAHMNSVAVLPFQNAGRDQAIDFLRFALPDEIATTLSHMRAVSIRPFAATSQYSGQALDATAIGREIHVNRVVTGHYVRAGENIQVTMEAVDVDNDRLLWRDTINIASGNLLGLQEQISAIARGKMASALGASAFAREVHTPPKNAEAYELFLRSMAIMTVDTGPNRQAISLLERSVALDPTYPPAWAALGSRYYDESRFAGGGKIWLQRSDQAEERALALDPDFIDAALGLILNRTERGELSQAYAQAKKLLDRRPDSSQAHHLMSYVLRYAGMLQDSARECDAAALLESGLWSACSSTFMELGNYAKARALLRSDLSSEWSKAHAIDILLRQGKAEEALRIRAPQIPGWESYSMVLECARNDARAATNAKAEELKPDDDPQVTYFFAAHLAYCGHGDAAVRMLNAAVSGQYCLYPAIDLDPLFDKVRNMPAFASARQAAIACQTQFRAGEPAMAKAQQ